MPKLWAGNVHHRIAVGKNVYEVKKGWIDAKPEDVAILLQTGMKSPDEALREGLIPVIDLAGGNEGKAKAEK